MHIIHVCGFRVVLFKKITRNIHMPIPLILFVPNGGSYWCVLVGFIELNYVGTLIPSIVYLPTLGDCWSKFPYHSILWIWMDYHLATCTCPVAPSCQSVSICEPQDDFGYLVPKWAYPFKILYFYTHIYT